MLGDRLNLDDEDENIDFYGLYSTYKGSRSLSADLKNCFAWRRNRDRANFFRDSCRSQRIPASSFADRFSSFPLPMSFRFNRTIERWLRFRSRLSPFNNRLCLREPDDA